MSGGVDMIRLNAEIKRAMGEVEQVAMKVQRRVGLQMFGDLVKTTPVDTGRARNGWVMSTGSASDYVPPEGGPYFTPDAPSLSRLQLGDTIWIANNVVYIRRLDEGWSKQAPAGMTAVAVRNLEAQFG